MTPTGTVRVSRTRSQWKDCLRAYKIELDGVVIGTLRNGGQAEFPIEPGHHRLAIKIDWAGSEPVDFTIAEHQTARFVCRATSLLAFHLYFQPSRYVELVHFGTAADPTSAQDQ